MTRKSLSAGLPPDHKEVYRLLLKYPLQSISIFFALLGAGFWVGQFYSKIESKDDKNNSDLEVKKEMQSIRDDERNRCDKLVADYKDLIIKLTPESTDNEKK